MGGGGGEIKVKGHLTPNMEPKTCVVYVRIIVIFFCRYKNYEGLLIALHVGDRGRSRVLLYMRPMYFYFFYLWVLGKRNSLAAHIEHDGLHCL